MLKRFLKNERGLTLIELLAVIVILGIVTAIAIPAIGNVIENSRRDAHIANARMILDAARLYMIDHPAQQMNDDITLEELVDDGYINNPTVPGQTAGYDEDATFVDVDRDAQSGNIIYRVKLVVGTTVVIGNEDAAVDLDTITRNNVKLP